MRACESSSRIAITERTRRILFHLWARHPPPKKKNSMGCKSEARRGCHIVFCTLVMSIVEKAEKQAVVSAEKFIFASDKPVNI